MLFGATQGKIWGTTRPIFHGNNVECHLIHFNKGGYCSQHTHNSKFNRFVVLNGVLRISQCVNKTVDKTILEEGDICDIPPGIEHRFEALTDGCALEVYWVELDPNDIDRHGSVGGENFIGAPE